MKKQICTKVNGAKDLTSSTPPDKANDLAAVRKENAARKEANLTTLGKTNGSIGGNISRGGAN